MKRKSLATLAVVVSIATAGGLAYASQNGKQENDAISDLSKARISLSQAIATAEQQVGGTATRAELENEGKALRNEVEVVASAGKVMDVQIDATDGKVISAKVDSADSERGDNEDGGD